MTPNEQARELPELPVFPEPFDAKVEGFGPAVTFLYSEEQLQAFAREYGALVADALSQQPEPKPFVGVRCPDCNAEYVASQQPEPKAEARGGVDGDPISVYQAYAKGVNAGMGGFIPADTEALLAEAVEVGTLCNLAAEDALGRMFQAVTGRPAEWSSAWGYADAIEEVEEHVAAIASALREQPAATDYCQCPPAMCNGQSPRIKCRHANDPLRNQTAPLPGVEALREIENRYRGLAAMNEDDPIPQNRGRSVAYKRVADELRAILAQRPATSGEGEES